VPKVCRHSGALPFSHISSKILEFVTVILSLNFILVVKTYALDREGRVS
jgi:hypothetical protein